MKAFGKTVMIGGVLVLAVAACGAGAKTTSDSQDTEPTTTTTTLPTTTTTEVHQEEGEGSHHQESHAPVGHEDDKGATAEAEVTIEVLMTDLEFKPSSFAIAAGQTVRFSISNAGLLEHEFRATNQHRIEEHLASGHQDHGEAGGHHQDDGDIVKLVQPGESAELIVTFPEDTTIYTEIACLLPGHYEAGMKAPIDYIDTTGS